MIEMHPNGTAIVVRPDVPVDVVRPVDSKEER